MFRKNFAKTKRLSMILAELIDIHLSTDYEWKVWYRREPPACVVSIETVAPLQDSAPPERARLTVEFLRQEMSGFISQELPPPDSRDLNRLISLKDLGLHARSACTRSQCDLAQLKQRWGGGWADSEQIIVEKAMDHWRKRLWRKDSTLTHAVTHCFTRHTVLYNWCFGQY